jgi:hypothetical protein
VIFCPSSNKELSVPQDASSTGLQLPRDITQNELWLKKYQEVTAFIETNHRNPSRHNPEERFKYCNWLKHNKKLLNAGEMKEDRVVLFEKLLELGEKYKRVNQYE